MPYGTMRIAKPLGTIKTNKNEKNSPININRNSQFNVL